MNYQGNLSILLKRTPMWSTLPARRPPAQVRFCKSFSRSSFLLESLCASVFFSARFAMPKVIPQVARSFGPESAVRQAPFAPRKSQLLSARAAGDVLDRSSGSKITSFKCERSTAPKPTAFLARNIEREACVHSFQLTQ